MRFPEITRRLAKLSRQVDKRVEEAEGRLKQKARKEPTPDFKATIQSTPSSPRARKLIEIYNSIPGASGPYCNPHSLAAVLEAIICNKFDSGDDFFMSDLITELRGETS